MIKDLMTIRLMGKIASQASLENLLQSAELQSLLQKHTPHLVIVQVGSNPASNAYIKQKIQRAQELKLRCTHRQLSANSNFALIRDEIVSLAQNPEINGIILQLPLDLHQKLSAEQVHELLECIPPHKDADGLHTYNQGQLAAGLSSASNWKAPLPATALGVIRLLKHYQIPLKSEEVVVIGRSRLVGTPTALLLLQEGATVSVCHSKTKDLSLYTKKAKIIVVAAGVKHLLKKEHISAGSVVIDVGIHRNNDGTLTGDCDPEIYDLCQAYSPVPGGVGPLTVGCLFENLLRLSLLQNSNS